MSTKRNGVLSLGKIWCSPTRHKVGSCVTGAISKQGQMLQFLEAGARNRR